LNDGYHILIEHGDPFDYDVTVNFLIRQILLFKIRLLENGVAIAIKHAVYPITAAMLPSVQLSFSVHVFNFQSPSLLSLTKST
jgi:hypothetical protein